MTYDDMKAEAMEIVQGRATVPPEPTDSDIDFYIRALVQLDVIRYLAEQPRHFAMHEPKPFDEQRRAIEGVCREIGIICLEWQKFGKEK
jgi:hypothetical protein